MTARPQFTVTAITPARPEAPRSVVALNLPGDGGRLTVLARHQPLICALRGGTIRAVNADEQPETWTISPGTISVERDGSVTLLVQRIGFEETPA